jgi:hypothetical protein
MAYLMTRCDFCNGPIDEGGRATQTNGWCSKHILLTHAIPKKAGKKPKGVIPITGGGDGHFIPHLVKGLAEEANHVGRG